MFKRSIGAVAAAAVLLTAAAAAAEPSPRALELARRYADAINMDNQLAAMMNSMMPAVLDQAASQRGTEVTPELKEAVARAAADAARSLAPKMLDRMAPFIADSFTEDELAAAVAYYESPLGRSFMAKSPAFIARAMPAMMAMAPEIDAELNARICQEIGCQHDR